MILILYSHGPHLELPRVHGDSDDARVGEASHNGEEFEEEIPDADVFCGFWHGSSSKEENLYRTAESSVHLFNNTRSKFVRREAKAAAA